MAQTESPDTGMSGTPARLRVGEDQDGAGTPVSGSTPPSDPRNAVSPAPASDISNPGSIHTDPDDDSRSVTKRELQRTRLHLKTMYAELRAAIAEEVTQREELEGRLVGRITTLGSQFDDLAGRVGNQLPPFSWRWPRATAQRAGIHHQRHG